MSFHDLRIVRNFPLLAYHASETNIIGSVFGFYGSFKEGEVYKKSRLGDGLRYSNL